MMQGDTRTTQPQGSLDGSDADSLSLRSENVPVDTQSHALQLGLDNPLSFLCQNIPDLQSVREALVRYKLTLRQRGVRISEHHVLNAGIKPTCHLPYDEQVLYSAKRQQHTYSSEP